jgi:hypothetical protein
VLLTAKEFSETASCAAQTVLNCQQQRENTQVYTTGKEYKTMWKSQKVHTCHTYLIPNDKIICLLGVIASWHAKLKIFAFLSKKTQHIFDISTRLKLFCACFSGDAPAKTCTIH